MRVRYVKMVEWPRLAWLAACTTSSQVVDCYVGPGVEISEDFFCEGVWTGPFERGDFDRTDMFFGSGVHVRPGGLVFVPSGSTVDRLQSLQQGKMLMVSNSLPCLLSVADDALDLGCRRYERIFISIKRGLRKCQTELPTTAGCVRLHYFDNFCWDGDGLKPVEKPFDRHDFSTYATYREFLDSSMLMLAENARALERRHPFALVSTLSAGYDSTTVSVLARQAGCDEVIGFDRSRGGEDDSGARIAELLRLRFHSFNTSAWRSVRGSVAQFLAGARATVPT